MNNLRVDAIINLVTNRATGIAHQALSDLSDYSIAQIGWFNRPGKNYSSMVVYFTQIAEAEGY